MLAFLAILTGGVFGAMIGFAFADIQCDGGCQAQQAGAAIFGGIAGALGVGIVAVLTLRAMGEWRRIKDSEN